MAEEISPTDQSVMEALYFAAWRLEEEAKKSLFRGMERFHRRHEIYVAYAKEKGRDPESLTECERQEAILGSILEEVEEV